MSKLTWKVLQRLFSRSENSKIFQKLFEFIPASLKCQVIKQYRTATGLCKQWIGTDGVRMHKHLSQSENTELTLFSVLSGLITGIS